MKRGRGLGRVEMGREVGGHEGEMRGGKEDLSGPAAAGVVSRARGTRETNKGEEREDEIQ
jgi:hypothetical protein